MPQKAMDDKWGIIKLQKVNEKYATQFKENVWCIQIKNSPGMGDFKPKRGKTIFAKLAVTEVTVGAVGHVPYNGGEREG